MHPVRLQSTKGPPMKPEKIETIGVEISCDGEPLVTIWQSARPGEDRLDVAERALRKYLRARDREHDVEGMQFARSRGDVSEAVIGIGAGVVKCIRSERLYMARVSA